MNKKGIYLSEEFGFNASMKTAKKPQTANKKEVKKVIKTTNTKKK